MLSFCLNQIVHQIILSYFWNLESFVLSVHISKERKKKTEYLFCIKEKKTNLDIKLQWHNAWCQSVWWKSVFLELISFGSKGSKLTKGFLY